MARTIGELVYQISADTRQFTAGVTLTRKEKSLLKAVMSDVSAEQKYAAQLDVLSDLQISGKLVGDQYNQMLRSVNAEFEEANGTAERARKSQAELNAIMDAGAKLAQAMLTPTEQYAQELMRLDGLLDKNATDQETYSRAVAKANQTLLSGVNNVERYQLELLALEQQLKRDEIAQESFNAAVADSKHRLGITDAQAAKPIGADLRSAGDTAAVVAAESAYNQALIEGKKLNEQYIDPLQKHVERTGRLNELKRLGVVGERAYTAALNASESEMRDATGETERLRKAEEAENREKARAKQILDSLKSPMDRHQEEVREYTELLKRGRLEQGQFNAAVAASAKRAAPRAEVKTDFVGMGRSALGAVGLGIGIAEGVSFLKSSIEAAEEAARAQLKLEAVFRATGNASGFSAQQIGDYSKTLQRATGVDDDAIKSAAGVLGTFKNVHGDVFTAAMGFGLDLAAVIDGDVKGAYLQLGKALDNPILGLTALRRAGVSFSDEQKDQIKVLQESGDILGAQKIILEALGGQLGGVAAGMKTPVAELSVEFGNLKEAIGGLFTQEKAGGKFFSFMSDQVRGLTKDVENLGGVLGGEGDVFRLLQGLLPGAGKAGGGLAQRARDLQQQTVAPAVPAPTVTQFDAGPTKDQIEAFSDVEEALNKEIAALQKAAEKTSDYDLASKDLTDTQRLELQGLVDKRTELERQKQVRKELADIEKASADAELSASEKKLVELDRFGASADDLIKANDMLASAERAKDKDKAKDDATKDAEKLRDMLADIEQAEVSSSDRKLIELDELLAKMKVGGKEYADIMIAANKSLADAEGSKQLKKDAEDAKKLAEDFAKKGLLPEEQLLAELKELQKALSTGLIDPALAKEAMAGVQKELDDLKPKMQKVSTENRALQRGTAEAFSALNRAANGVRDPGIGTEKNTARTAKATEELNKGMRDLAKEVKKPTPIKVVNF